MEQKKLGQEESGRPKYEVPTVRVMDEKEVLTAFQITSAGSTWWG